MLKELYLFYSTPCQPLFRQSGHLKELIAIESKYQRVKWYWQPHFKQTKSIIIQACEKLEQHRKVIVLGSGLLLDVPLEELSETFSEVTLVDIAMLNKTRRKIKKFSNVKFIDADITGLTSQLLSYNPADKLPDANMTIPGLDENTDLVISLNLFSQLPITFRQWLGKKYMLTESKLEIWSIDVMKKHLKVLNELKTSVLVIGDMKHDYIQFGHQVEQDDFKQLLGLPEQDKQWQWLISPPGEMPKDYKMQSQVGAWFNWQDKIFN